ncbi:MAG: hypothetical protein PVSMB9_03560 [Candidatus Dormibacteria bacterium]
MSPSQATLPRLVAIFGSGETTSTMTSVHQGLIARVGDPEPGAVLLDTPFGFQPNADDITARVLVYFRDRVGCEMKVATLRNSERASAFEIEQFLARVAAATYVFAGPGSPSYAVKHWRDRRLREELRQKLVTGGCLAFASAAAIGLGAYALPVYEIYKVGADPSWIEGLDLLSELGIRAAVIPHYDNQEGGTHDTRYCYMGEDRLRLLEAMLPDDALILGVDEHTACIIDRDAQSVTVRGRGGVTLRKHGSERRFERTTFPVRELVDPALAAASPLSETSRSNGESAPAHDQFREQVAPLVDVLLTLRREARLERRFQDADRLRTVLIKSGIEVQDTPTGTAWSVSAARTERAS